MRSLRILDEKHVSCMADLQRALIFATDVSLASGPSSAGVLEHISPELFLLHPTTSSLRAANSWIAQFQRGASASRRKKPHLHQNSSRRSFRTSLRTTHSRFRPPGGRTRLPLLVGRNQGRASLASPPRALENGPPSACRPPRADLPARDGLCDRPLPPSRSPARHPPRSFGGEGQRVRW